jgi:hypothetical protein
MCYIYKMDYNWDKIYKEYNFITNNDDITKFMCYNICEKEGGFFLNRIAGSDYNAVYEYYTCLQDLNKFNYTYNFKNTCEYNGYFDKSTNDEEKKTNFFKYLQKMFDCYINSDAFTNAVGFIQNSFKNPVNDFNKLLSNEKTLIHYNYIEGVMPFLLDFKIFGINKTILIVSPFSESIKYQTQVDRIKHLVNNYNFPLCNFKTYDTPVTYNNTDKEDIDKLIFVETNNWLEQCKKMENDISKLDFDIALLSCGSYATCLGNFISKTLNKKAIYIGGVLNIFFNIKGGRYDNDDFYTQLNNLSYRIEAIEKNKYDYIKGGRLNKTEAFNAYF